MDRTNWFRKNLLTIIFIYDQRAIPIYFEVLPKLESSNLLEQKRIFTQALPLCKKLILWFIGDREFGAVKPFECLREQ